MKTHIVNLKEQSMLCPHCKNENKIQPISIGSIYLCSHCDKKFVFIDKDYVIAIIKYRKEQEQ